MANAKGIACCACHRCHRRIGSCACGGGQARRSARLRRGADGDGADRIRALHDDLLLHILARLGCVHAAARTGLLSRRWRGLCTRLPELVLREINPESLVAVLARLVVVFYLRARRTQPQAALPSGEADPPLSLLAIHAPSDRWFSLDQIFLLFKAAKTRQPASLILDIRVSTLDLEPPVLVTLPYLDRTKSIMLDMRGVGLYLRPSGDLPKLESLSFGRYNVVLGGLLGLCSALRCLSISDLCLDFITIDLPLLEELFLLAKVRLHQVVINAPRLKKLSFHATDGVADGFTLWYMAPEVEDLSWKCTDYMLGVQFGGIWCLKIVTIKTSEPLGRLQYSPHPNTLSLGIWERWEAFVQEGAAPSFEHYISSICPDASISVLDLCINSCGHVYGAMVLHLLEVYALIEGLKVDVPKFQAKALCSPNCPCIQLNNWRSQTISLTHLKEMEIKGSRGEDHEIDMVEVILRSAAMLERVAATFNTKSEQRIRRFSFKIHSILKAYPSVDCKIYRCSSEQVLSA